MKKGSGSSGQNPTHSSDARRATGRTEAETDGTTLNRATPPRSTPNRATPPTKSSNATTNRPSPDNKSPKAVGTTPVAPPRRQKTTTTTPLSGNKQPTSTRSSPPSLIPSPRAKSGLPNPSPAASSSKKSIRSSGYGQSSPSSKSSPSNRSSPSNNVSPAKSKSVIPSSSRSSKETEDTTDKIKKSLQQQQKESCERLPSNKSRTMESNNIQSSTTGVTCCAKTATTTPNTTAESSCCSNTDTNISSSCCSSKKPKDVLLQPDDGNNKKPYCCFCGDACTCGDDCCCSEELCQCTAYQVVHSLGPKTNKKTQTAEWSIGGMTCSMCSQSVERALHNLPGVIQGDISLATDTAQVVWDPSQCTVSDITTAIEDVGYTVEHVVALSKNNDPTERNNNNPNNDQSSTEERWERYRQRQTTKVEQRRNAFLWSLVGTIPIVSLTMILSHISALALVLHHPVLNNGMTWEALILWILATPVQFICGWEFYKMAWHGFRTGQAGMDVLVALGTSASYGYALFGAWHTDHEAAHFFETSAVLIAFVLAGKWMQAAAVRRTSEALTQLMELQSPTAIKVTPLVVNDTNDDESFKDGVFNPLKEAYTEAIVDSKEINVGDLVKVIRGASIPADGHIMFGEISVDESMVTGESVPVLKTRGDVVLGGTICVETGGGGDTEGTQPARAVGASFVRVTGVGSATALAQIVQLVQDAQTRSVPIQSFADQVSAIFVPVVCTISLVTYLVWYAFCASNVVPESWYHDDYGEDAATFSLMFAIACLVISCPCALGLATPTAVMVGTGVGAKLGVLIKGGEALETASKVDSVVFDKTGTLTKGKPVVTDFVRVDSGGVKSDQSTTDYYLWLLGSLERNSEHPLARAIVAHAEEELGDALEDNPFVQPTEFRGITGRGASGLILGKINVAVGNRSFASMLQLHVSPEADFAMNKLEEGGKTAILVAIDGLVCLVLGIADALKSDAASSIAYLRDEMGLDVWMVTGDNARTAAAISRKLRLPPERVISEALPAAKLEQVGRLQAEGHVVAMVGDGVNDSPALAEADVGISLGSGAEIATEASDMVLVRGNVTDVITALHLSRAIFQRIQWNLLWSLVYNCLGIPIAAGAFYPLFHTRLHPTVAAVAMAMSSISVVLSSLTLRLYKPPAVEERNRRRSTTLWARAMSSRDEFPNDDSMRVGLLSQDHLASSEITERMDNRTARRMEEGS